MVLIPCSQGSLGDPCRLESKLSTEMDRKYAGNIQEIHRKYGGNMLEIDRKYAGNAVQ